MKALLTLAALLFILNNVYASKARLQALGESKDGSQYISDNRNIFLNPAHSNLHRDIVTYEWGNTNNAADSVAAPKSEGGFLKAQNNFVYGLHLGHESSTSTTLRTSAGITDATVSDEVNNVDFFLAGDAGVQWGANITYGNFVNEQGTDDSSSSVLRANFGLIQGDLEGFARVSLTNSADQDDGTTEAEYSEKQNYDVGANFNFNEMILMARMQALEAENEDDDLTYNYMMIGVGKVHNLNDKAKFFTRVNYYTSTYDSDFAGDIGEFKQTAIPIVIGLEFIAKEWLTLRGSVAQPISGTSEDDDSDKATIEYTNVNAGASLVFGDFNIDGVVGNDADGAGVDATTTAGGNGTLRTDSLMSRVSMTYRF